MAAFLSARASPTSDATIALVLILGQEKDVVWRHLFNETLPPFEPYDLSEELVDHGARDDGHAVFAELKIDAPVETVLRTLDWLSDTVDAIDEEYRRYLDLVKRANNEVLKWFQSYKGRHP